MLKRKTTTRPKIQSRLNIRENENPQHWNLDCYFGAQGGLLKCPGSKQTAQSSAPFRALQSSYAPAPRCSAGAMDVLGQKSCGQNQKSSMRLATRKISASKLISPTVALARDVKTSPSATSWQKNCRGHAVVNSVVCARHRGRARSHFQPSES